MKKIIYSLSIALVAGFTSCGEAKEEAKEEVKEEAQEETIDEDILEEGVVMVNGLQFFGNNEFELTEWVSVDEMYAAIMETGTFEGLVKAEISEGESISKCPQEEVSNAELDEADLTNK